MLQLSLALPQLANVLTIQELQNRKPRTRINISPAKKLTYLFGEALAKLAYAYPVVSARPNI
jgi:hypothetical protein